MHKKWNMPAIKQIFVNKIARQNKKNLIFVSWYGYSNEFSKLTSPKEFMQKKNKIIVIGAGFSGISAATHLAAQGYDVTILEKNSSAGGRARCFSEQGFHFDMGPSWYWMPDVFDAYFEFFGKKTSDYYDLVRLNPSYTVAYAQNDFMQIPADYAAVKQLFDSIEPGSAVRLDAFLAEAKYKYEVGMGEFVGKPSLSIFEFMKPKYLVDAFRLDLFSAMDKHVRKFFSHEKLIKLMEFPVLFLGALPKNTPALYSLMNYADIALGTWYPMGGMGKIIEGMLDLAQEKGVKIIYNAEVTQINAANKTVSNVVASNKVYETDVVIASADYHHVEQQILQTEHRHYDEKYWETRVMAPSSLLFYLGVNKKLNNLTHHTLFFDEDLDQHAVEIYEQPQWPTKPLFYVSATSQTDPSVAPEGCENLFVLVPLAPNLTDTEEIREKYYNIVMDRLERLTNQSIKSNVVYKRSYAHTDFMSDYNAYKGNAYGLANVLKQTAILKPRLKSKKLDNLYFTGQLTVPGPGVPPSLISGKVVANQIMKDGF